MRLTIQENDFLRYHFGNNNIFSKLATFSDASRRQYSRVLIDGSVYMLVIYSKDMDDSFYRYCYVSSFLSDNNFKVPEMIITDHERKMMLIEDFGDNLFINHLKSYPNDVLKLYDYAIDVLIRLHNINISEFQSHNFSFDDNQSLLKGIILFLEYIEYATPMSITAQDKQDYLNVWKNYLNEINLEFLSIALYDFHSPNLFFFPDKEEKIGIIDFQDAKISNNYYDVVSLLNDARTFISEGIFRVLFSKFHDSCLYGISLSKSLEIAQLLGLQRNLRIIGVFLRQKYLYNNDSYEKYINLVKGYIKKYSAIKKDDEILSFLYRKKVII